jgi:hypothetical protein
MWKPPDNGSNYLTTRLIFVFASNSATAHSSKHGSSSQNDINGLHYKLEIGFLKLGQLGMLFTAAFVVLF